MKKLIIYLPKLFVTASLFITVGCNSGSTTTEGSDSVSMDTSRSTVENNQTPEVADSSSAMKTGPTNDANVAMTPNDFISKNIADNTMEVDMSKMGRDKGTDAQVKKVANLMITEHTQMNADLKKLAGKKQLTLPATNTAGMAAMPSMPETKGKEFDQAWASQMLTMHDAKINELQNVLTQTEDADIKALINKALPKVKVHRDMLAKITSTTGSTQPQ
jgi:putative membrane protein